MESDSIHSEQDKSDVMKITDPNEVCGQSGVYMFIFYTVSRYFSLMESRAKADKQY